MSFIVKLNIGGWITTAAIVAYCALEESGKLREIRNRMSSWLEVATAGVRASEDNA
jgi:hypothetical protein